MTLSDTQRLVLSAAMQHLDGVAVPPATLPPAPRAAVAKALLKAGLLAPAQAAEAPDPSVAWKLDGAAVILRITEAGRQAVGAIAAEVISDPAVEAHSESLAAAAVCAACDAPNDAEAAQQPPAAPQRAPRRQALHEAAQAIVAAWDAGGDRHGLPDAIDRLHAALAKPAARRTTGGAHQPRQGTKQETVLAMLRRPEGASGPQLIEATGWAPHTVRGFLAGLARKSITVTVLERVRQIGPNKAGARGSYTIYRIAEAR